MSKYAEYNMLYVVLSIPVVQIEHSVMMIIEQD